MQRPPLPVIAQLAVTGALAAMSLIQVQALRERAAAPLEARDRGGIIEVVAVTYPREAGGIGEGDRLIGWNGEALRTADALELSANLLRVGDHVRVSVVSGNLLRETEIVLVPAYGAGYGLVVAVLGLACIALGAFVLLAQPRNPTAALLHWPLVWMGVVVMTAYEGTPAGPLGIAGSLLFFLSYMGVAICFCLFTLHFPRPIAANTIAQSLVVAAPGALVMAGTAFQYVRAVSARSIRLFMSYNELYQVFHVVILLYAAIGIWAVVHSYRSAPTTGDRRKLQWVAWGFAVGPSPFLLLTVLPQIFQPKGLVPEIYTLPFLVLVPVSLVVSFVRYRLLDIEVVIRRTTAYAAVLVALLGLYLALVAVAAAMVGEVTASSGAAVVVALLLEPARGRVQRLVDRYFFREQYDLRVTEKRMVQEIRESIDESGLARHLVDGVAALIPVERIGMYAIAPGGNSAPRFLLGRGYGLEQEAAFPAALLGACCRGLPVANHGVLEPEVRYERVEGPDLERMKLALVVPMPAENGGLAGLLVLGRKKAGNRFAVTDMDLLSSLAVQAGLALRRFAVQRELFEGHAEMERLAALNRVKSEFVANVSHELRTPLTSIRMFTELLAAPERGLDPKGEEYLRIIGGESDRLARMVTTILDSAQIEQGARVYAMEDVDLRDAADAAMRAMQFQLESQHFTVRYVRSRTALRVRGDADALADAIVNLIGNAVKYSAAIKWLRVCLTRVESTALCSVEDQGIGISAEAFPRIFEKFYRDPGSSGKIRGIGLGLPLVRHIIESHQGTVEVQSALGTGSVFTIRLPLAVRPAVRGTSRKTDHEIHPRH